MVAIRMWQIETGRVRVNKGGAFPYAQFVEEVAVEAKDACKRALLILAAKVLFTSSRIFDWAKGVLRRQVVRMEKKLVREKSAVDERQGAVSLFLKDVAEHKRVLKAQIRRQAKMFEGG